MDPEAAILKLTPYEVERQPHEVPRDDSVLMISGRLVENELQCGICLSLLRNTRVTKECLHRFCDECISHALRTGNKSCPTCRHKLISMRSLRPDSLFDQIIKTLYPRHEEMEEHEAALLAKLQVSSKTGPRRRENEKGTHIGQATAIEEPVTGTSGTPEEPVEGVSGTFSHTHVPGEISEEPVTETSGTCSSAVEERTIAEEPVGSADLTEFELTPYIEKTIGHGNSDLVGKWKKRLVRVNSSAKVGLVSCFILTRWLEERDSWGSADDIKAEDVSKVQIYMRLKYGRLQLLEHDQTLVEVHALYWKAKRPMKLCFAFARNMNIELKY